MPRRQPFIDRLRVRLEQHAIHIIETATVIIGLWAVGRLIDQTVGPHAMFFDRVPVHWLPQAGEVGALLRLACYATFGTRER